MSHPWQDPLAHPEVQLASARRYLVGTGIASGLMFASLWVVEAQSLSPAGLLAALGVLAALAVVAQLRYLLELDLSENRIWHSVALALIVPLFALAVGLTAWMFHALLLRTMLHGTGM